MVNLDGVARRNDIAQQVQEFQLHRSTVYTERLVRLLDALFEDTLFDLATAAPERLAFKQGALAQIRALREAVKGDDAQASPKAV